MSMTDENQQVPITDVLDTMKRSGDLEWAPPAMVRPTGRRPSMFWAEVAAMAKSQPHAWLKVANRAQGTAQRIRAGTIGAFAEGSWDATQVRTGVDEFGKVLTDVYIMYCGPQTDRRAPVHRRKPAAG